MQIRNHVHYVITLGKTVTKQICEFDPPVEIESPVQVEDFLFFRANPSASYTMRFADRVSTMREELQAPVLLRDTSLHISDTASSVSVNCPQGWVLSNIDPGSVRRAEVDLTTILEPDQAGEMVRALVFLFINPQPASPVPFNIDAEFVKDKHNYLRRITENRDRAYHKLLVRKCLAPGYQVWPEVMDFETASVYCDRVKSTIATWVREGWVKASPGTKPLILKKNLDAYLESR